MKPSFERLRAAPESEAFAPLAARVRPDAAEPRASVFPDLSAAPVAAVVTPDSDAAAEVAAHERAEALRAARTEGFAAGKAAAEQQYEAAAAAFGAAVEEVVRFRTGLLERYQTELLELALGIARKVVQRELAEHPEHWLGMIREAVRHALDRDRIRIRVGSILHKVLLERLPELRALLEDVKELELVEDPSLSETGCVIESHYGDLDLGIDTQIGAIRAALGEAT